MIEISRTPEQVLLEVRDEGKGISASSRTKRGRLWNPGHARTGQTCRSLKTVRYEFAPIGADVARQFNGELTIESSGKGTLFRVTIPVSKKEAAIEEQKAQME